MQTAFLGECFAGPGPKYERKREEKVDVWRPYRGTRNGSFHSTTLGWTWTPASPLDSIPLPPTKMGGFTLHSQTEAAALPGFKVFKLARMTWSGLLTSS